jgi:hypothetical protein
MNMPGIPANITIPNTTIKGRVAPFIDTARPNGYRANDPANSGGGGGVGVLFETNFSADTNYSISGTSNWEAGAPTGFDLVQATGNCLIEVVPQGAAGANVMRLHYDPAQGQPVIGLRKHLTNDINTGYDELYIRYKVRFPNAYKFGNGSVDLPYWKWLRLAQNTAADLSGVFENRPDSYYVVGQIGGSINFAVKWSFAFAGNEEDGTDAERIKGSAGGPHATIDWYKAGNPLPHSAQAGYFEAMPGFDIDWATNPGRFESFTSGGSQSDHTIEMRIKTATAPGADDGVCELFFDGVSQGIFQRVTDAYSPDTGPITGVPTASNPAGWNAIQFFDNMSNFNLDFGQADVDGYVDIFDLVVSTERIGHDYAVGA